MLMLVYIIYEYHADIHVNAQSFSDMHIALGTCRSISILETRLKYRQSEFFKNSCNGLFSVSLKSNRVSCLSKSVMMIMVMTMK